VRRWLVCGALLAVGWPMAAAWPDAGGACAIRPVALSLAGGRSSGVSIMLADGNELAGGAMVWDEPMRLAQADGTSCAVDARVSIITGPMFDAGGRVLYVTTYSGSRSKVFGVSMGDCRVLWESGWFTRGPVLEGERLQFSDAPAVEIGGDCLPRA